jgi:RsiW-degrading membrane proteinase PrsW (M82 family)
VPKLILILISFSLGVASVRHLRRFDVHEQEPLGKMLAVTLWGGMVSIVLSLFLYSILHGSGISIEDGFPFSYLFIGFIEEGAKLLALLCCWGLIRKEMDEPTDGLIYMACVALGFSLIENFFYAARTPSTTILVGLRLIICTPMHIAFSLFMGLAFFRAAHHLGRWGTLLNAYLFASFYHSLYDIFVSWWYLLPGLYLVIKGAYGWMYRLLGYTAATSPFRKSLAEFVYTFPAAPIEPGIECLNCGNTAPKNTYKLRAIRLQKCTACNAMVCTQKSLIELVRHFGSTFGSLRKQWKPDTHRRKNFAVLVAANRVDRKKKLACFELEDFDKVLEKMSKDVILQAQDRWWNRPKK